MRQTIVPAALKGVYEQWHFAPAVVANGQTRRGPSSSWRHPSPRHPGPRHSSPRHSGRRTARSAVEPVRNPFRDANDCAAPAADVTEWIPDTRAFASLGVRSGMTPGREAAQPADLRCHAWNVRMQ